MGDTRRENAQEVSKVSAWADNRGVPYATRMEALRSNARRELDCSGVPWSVRNVIMEHSMEIYRALKPMHGDGDE